MSCPVLVFPPLLRPTCYQLGWKSCVQLFNSIQQTLIHRAVCSVSEGGQVNSDLQYACSGLVQPPCDTSTSLTEGHLTGMCCSWVPGNQDGVGSHFILPVSVSDVELNQLLPISTHANPSTLTLFEYFILHLLFHAFFFLSGTETGLPKKGVCVHWTMCRYFAV